MLTSGALRGKTMFDGRALRSYFKKFNELYFGNHLPAYSIRVIRGMGYSGFCNGKRRLIKIRADQSPEETIGTQLHEMAHAATNDGHGGHWKKEMIRLREAGAPVASAERSICSETRDGKKVTRAHFQLVVQDVLADSPAITLSEALRHFSSIEGGPDTITHFLRKYPWVRAVFRDEKKKFIEEQKSVAELRARLGLQGSKR